MKTIVIIAACFLFAGVAKAQSNKEPVYVEDAPTIFTSSYNPYYDYSDQGNRMYINNSHFYNKDNIITNSFPQSNGFYLTPGNSNPINRDMNDGAPIPSGTIYSGYIPVRDYGNSSSGRSDYIR